MRTFKTPSKDITVQKKYHVLDDAVVHEESHDVSGIIKANKFQQSTQSMRHQSEATNQVARIDTLAIKNWMAQRGITVGWWEMFFKDDKLLKEFLNDPDNRVWRTRLGKV